jgi:hypothetical protein
MTLNPPTVITISVFIASPAVGGGPNAAPHEI